MRNVGMGQLLTEIVITAIKKDMIDEILRRAFPGTASKVEGAWPPLGAMANTWPGRSQWSE